MKHQHIFFLICIFIFLIVVYKNNSSQENFIEIKDDKTYLVNPFKYYQLKQFKNRMDPLSVQSDIDNFGKWKKFTMPYQYPQKAIQDKQYQAFNVRWKIKVWNYMLCFIYDDFIIGGIKPNINGKGGKLFDTMPANSSPIDTMIDGNIKCNGFKLYSVTNWSIVARGSNIYFCSDNYVMGGIRANQRSDGRQGGKFFSTVNSNTENKYINNISVNKCNGITLVDLGDDWNISIKGSLLFFCYKNFTQSGVQSHTRTDGRKGGNMFVTMSKSSQRHYVDRVTEGNLRYTKTILVRSEITQYLNKKNIASQSNGGIPFGSGSLPRYCINSSYGIQKKGQENPGSYERRAGKQVNHCYNTINDGIVGDERSWIPGPPYNGKHFVGIVFKKSYPLTGFRVSRDVTGVYKDRWHGVYRVFISTDKIPISKKSSWKNVTQAKWVYIGKFTRRSEGIEFFSFKPPILASAIKIEVSDSNSCIDELEVYSNIIDDSMNNYVQRFFKWDNVKYHILGMYKFFNPKKCLRKCQDNNKCTAWEQCRPGPGCEGCYLFKGYYNQPESTPFNSCNYCYAGVKYKKKPEIFCRLSDSSTTIIGDNSTKIIRSQRYSSIEVTPNFCLSFIIKPQGIVSNWSSIIHFTISNKNCCNAKDRCPAIFFRPGNTKICVVIGNSSKGNLNFSTNNPLPLNQNTKVILTVTGNKAYFKCYNELNIVFENHTVTIPGIRPLGLAYVYVGDPWYEPAKALIKNIKYQADKYSRCKSIQNIVSKHNSNALGPRKLITSLNPDIKISNKDSQWFKNANQLSIYNYKPSGSNYTKNIINKTSTDDNNTLYLNSNNNTVRIHANDANCFKNAPTFFIGPNPRVICNLKSTSSQYRGTVNQEGFVFNGNQSFRIPQRIAPQLADSDFTIEFWAKLNSHMIQPFPRYYTVYQQGDINSSWQKGEWFNISFMRNASNNQVYFYNGLQKQTLPNGHWSCYLNVTPLMNDTWHHYAISYKNNGESRIYIDGKLRERRPKSFISNPPVTYSNVKATGDVIIGRAGKNTFIGSLKKLKVYNKVRTSQQINQSARLGGFEQCTHDVSMYIPMIKGERSIYYNAPKTIIKCFNQPKNFVPFSKKISDLDISKYATLKTFITGENAIICRGIGRCPGQSLVSQNLIQNKICIKCSTYIDDTLIRNHKGGSATSSSNSEYLLYNYNKQWWVSGGGNRRVSAVFNFSVPVKLTNFIFATYNGGRIGRYRGWNLYYKKDNSWVKVLDYNNRSVYIPSADYISSERSHGIPISNSEFSNEWKFEVLPTRNVYIYWVKMYGFIYTNKISGCTPNPLKSGEKLKPGNNGTVSGNTFCRGNWQGWSAANCVRMRNNKNCKYMDCNIVPFSKNKKLGNYTATCSNVYPKQKLKRGNNGTVSGKMFCNGTWGGWSAQYCKNMTSVDKGRVIDCNTVPGLNSGGPNAWTATCTNVFGQRLKPGNNGTVSGNTFCRGKWQGWSLPGCINMTATTRGRIVDCNTVPGLNSGNPGPVGWTAVCTSSKLYNTGKVLK